MASNAQIQRISQIERVAPKPPELDLSVFTLEELRVLQRFYKGEASAAERQLVETKFEPIFERQREQWPVAYDAAD